MTKEKRNYGLDLLRIISMIMIVTIHYCTFGYNILKNGSIGSNTPALWLIYAFCFGAVNLYVLLSGYFLCESKFKWKKLFRLWIEVIFYSILIFLILKWTGNLKELLPREKAKIFLPVIGKSYWFVSIYFVMYIISPFLNILVKNLEKKEYQKLLIIGVVLIILNNIIPGTFIIDANYGYGIIWFVYLYLCGAYIRKNDVSIKHNYLLLLSYILFTLLTFGSRYFILKYCQNLELYKNEFNSFYNYNSITIFLASISLFIFFKNLKLKEIFPKLVSKISYSNFGVYLIHVNFILNPVLYEKILKVSYYASQRFIVKSGAMIISVIAVFSICIVIDIIRQLIFKILRIE